MSTEPSIRLHPKFGLNPTIPICIYCDKERNEVALLGAAYPGEAPMRMAIDEEPCDKCLAQMVQGITLFGVVDGESRRRTGRFIVLTEEGARKLFSENIIEGVLRRGCAEMDEQVLNQILLQVA